MPRHRHYTQTERNKIVRAVKRGVPIAHLAEKHGVTRVSIHGWVRDHDEWHRLKRSGQIPPAISRHLAAIKAENRALAAEISELRASLAETEAMDLI